MEFCSPICERCLFAMVTSRSFSNRIQLTKIPTFYSIVTAKKILQQEQNDIGVHHGPIGIKLVIKVNNN